MLVDTAWPVADAALTLDATVTVAVQVNGKLCATLQLPRDASKQQAEAAALALPEVQRVIVDKPVRRAIVVPNRVVNVVV